MELIRAPNLLVPHAFTTRSGGVSEAPYSSLNLGLASGDAQNPVAENRRRVLGAFGTDERGACAFNQIHSAHVIEGEPSWFEREADAVVTNRPDLLLVVSTADCLPVLFHDPVTGAVGAAHCGWRGTVAGMAVNTLNKLTALYGSEPADVQIAFGPSITQQNYQVGPEVVEAFERAGFPESVYEADGCGRYRLDVAAANRWQLLTARVRLENLWESGLCTYADEARFYSHRRDGGRTGRHWAVIRSTAQES